MRLVIALIACCIFALPVDVLAQSPAILDNRFDPYVGAISFLPDSAFSQEGEPIVSDAEMNVSTFRVRETGRIETYLKVEISYLVMPSVSGQAVPIAVQGAFYEGGRPADFESIQQNIENCTASACRVTEILSVRFPAGTTNAGTIAVQFRNRTSSWRGTVVVPAGTVAINERALRGIPN